MVPAIAPRFLFIFASFFFVVEKKRREFERPSGTERRKQPRQMPQISKIPGRVQQQGRRSGSATLTELPAHEHALSEMQIAKLLGGAQHGDERTTAWWSGVEWSRSRSSTYDEAAVELLLEVRADVGVGEEVRRHGGARTVLRPPRIALVVVGRRGARGWPGRRRRVAHPLPSPKSRSRALGQPAGGMMRPAANFCVHHPGAAPLEVPIFKADCEG